MALVEGLEQQLAASRATAGNLVVELIAGAASGVPSANGAPQTSPGQRPGSRATRITKG